MPKYKMIIVTHPELAAGFRLAGVEVFEAHGREDVNHIIGDVMRNKDYGVGIIGIDEELNSQVDPQIIEELEERGLPLLIPFPAAAVYSWEREKREESYAANLVRNAIGYHIKLKR